MPGHTPNPRLGYILAASAATLFAFNGSLAQFLLDDGVSAWHLSALRSVGAFVLLACALGLFARDQLRIARPDVPRMAFLGIFGLALVTATYFAAIERIDIGVALVIQYLAPLVLLLWLRFRHGRRLAASLWGAVWLSVAGCFLVVEAYDVSGLDGLGLAAAFGACATFAIYLVASERAGRDYPAVTTLTWGFGFSTLFWLVVTPPWTFPVEQFDSARDVALAASVVVVGTLVPFVLIVGALRHLPAPRVAVVATLEPVLAAIIAWAVHDQVLAPPQVLGGLIVIAAVLWVQSHRPSAESESAPAYRESRAAAAEPVN